MSTKQTARLVFVYERQPADGEASRFTTLVSG
jgi:hypothetical protein